MTHDKEPTSDELSRLTPEIIDEAVKLVFHHHVYTEPAGSREAMASSDRRSAYDLSHALYDILVAPDQSEPPENFSELRNELELSLEDDELVQAALQRNRAEADRLNRSSRS